MLQKEKGKQQILELNQNADTAVWYIIYKGFLKKLINSHLSRY